MTTASRSLPTGLAFWIVLILMLLLVASLDGSLAHARATGQLQVKAADCNTPAAPPPPAAPAAPPPPAGIFGDFAACGDAVQPVVRK